MTQGVRSPEHWEFSSLGELASYVTSGSRNWSKYYSDDGALFVRTEDIKTNQLDLSSVAHVTLPESVEGKRSILQASDLLITITGANVGKCAVVPPNMPEAYISQSIALVRLVSTELSPFLHLAMQVKGTDGKSELERMAYGVGRPVLNLTNVREARVGLPPQRERHLIVEAIESYLTRLDDAIASLDRVQRNLKRYRSSVLKAAVEGRLVPTEAELARHESRQYEPASELLKCILAERKARWIEDAAEKASAKAEEKARKAGQSWTDRDDAATLDKERAKAAKQYKEPATPDTTDLPGLPEGWCWATVEQLSSEIRYGYTASAVQGDAGPRFLRITDIQEGRVDWGSVPTCDIAPVDVDSYELAPGDLVFARTGATTGKSYLIGEAPKAVFASYLIRMRFLAGAKPDYTYLFFQSAAYWRQISAAKKGTGQPGVNATTLSGVCVPLPPEVEQTRIAEAAWSLITRSENVAATAAEQIRRATCLRQSLLKWAFEGRLVEQDPKDEPASALLDRIRAERAVAGAPKARGRGKRSAE